VCGCCAVSTVRRGGKKALAVTVFPFRHTIEMIRRLLYFQFSVCVKARQELHVYGKGAQRLMLTEMRIGHHVKQLLEFCGFVASMAVEMASQIYFYKIHRSYTSGRSIQPFMSYHVHIDGQSDFSRCLAGMQMFQK